MNIHLRTLTRAEEASPLRRQGQTSSSFFSWSRWRFLPVEGEPRHPDQPGPPLVESSDWTVCSELSGVKAEPGAERGQDGQGGVGGGASGPDSTLGQLVRAAR